MNRFILTLSASVFMASSAFAQIATIDNANLDVARENASNTKSIMDSNKDIQEKSMEILKSLTGNRTANLGMASQGLGGGSSIAQAPSFSSVLNGGALSFGGLGGDVQKVAGTIINGLQLVKTLQNVTNGSGSNGTVNDLYSGSVNVMGLLSALNQQASQGIQSRESGLQTATNSIGQSTDVKGSVDENTRMQLESARAVNELIGVQNAAVAAANEDLKQKLTRQSQVTKMLTPKSVNPF